MKWSVAFPPAVHTDWRSLLLPSSPPAQTPLLPRPSLPWSSTLNWDVPQDFHLPDEQFASLKLHKLRQVAVDRGPERFSSPSYNTRRSLRQYESRCSEPPSPLSLPFCLTPTVSHSPRTPARCPDPPTSAASGPVGSQTASGKSSGPGGGAEVASPGAADLLPDCPLVPEDQCEGRDTGKTSEFTTHAAAEQQRGFVTGHSSEVEIKAGFSGDETDAAAGENPARGAEDPREEASASSTAQHHCPRATVDPWTAPTGEVPAEEQRLQPLAVHTQLLLSPPPASAPRPPSSALHGSLPLPSLGLTPQVDPLTCSPSAPALTLPPPAPHPDALPLSPPPLSPCPSPPPSRAAAPQSHELRVCAAASQSQSEFLDGQFVQRMEEAEPRLLMSCTHTLKVRAVHQLWAHSLISAFSSILTSFMKQSTVQCSENSTTSAGKLLP